ncbi:unnamed protein product [Penicillium salamii]|uniref:DUF7580 domain-containing protein n=1 Tax=Penicillium salamii TaxID=1612424 RepID=A0A9W4NTM0_9EURO|nr:unnamed protein product [Penicillium salamii]CAG8257242.1 unnamed protein product [Penicillium salamii]CAG8375144.1 unnamed protein product [Penicillium salamii]CAG8399241.1 unnamed protein product [Penicillium salamii]CAG8405598.1 unnamed protein product [Penicillium salamii]
MSCKRFMGDVASQCGIEAGEVDVLINDPNHPRWSDGSFEHTPVINQQLIGLQGSTTKDGEDARPELLDKTTRRRQWKKIVLVLRKDGITRHLEQAVKLNEFLAFLTQQSHYFIPSNHTPRRNTKHYQQIRSHAIDLYDILKANFPQMPNCKCPLRHDVNMKLEFRSGGMVTKRLLFRTIFTSEVPIFSLQNWCEIDIEPLEIQKTTLCRDSQESVTMRIATRQSSSSDITQFQNRKTPEKQHRIWTTGYQPQQPAFQIIRTVSLAEVLGDKDFQREQRSRLGLKLVSSVMQLHTTQWLMDIWSKTDISFACSTEGTVDFDNPLIRRSFGSGSQNCNVSSPSRNLPRPYLVASIPCLFSLGVVLLELWYGKVLESLKNEDERNMPPQFSDPLCARRLTDELVCGPYFKNAVLRCICGLDAVYTSLEEDAFRDEVEEKIVCPLEEDLKFYCGKTSINECI